MAAASHISLSIAHFLSKPVPKKDSAPI